MTCLGRKLSIILLLLSSTCSYVMTSARNYVNITKDLSFEKQDTTYNNLERVVLKGKKKGCFFRNKWYLSQDDFSSISGKNKVFIVKKHFILTEDINIPEGSILVFDGGSIKGASVYWPDISVSGKYSGNKVVYKNRIIIRKGVILEDFDLDGYLVIDTKEKVVLRNCNVYLSSCSAGDYLLMINKPNANIDILNCKIHSDNHNIRYGIYTPYQIESFNVKNCEFYGFREIAINCSNRIIDGILESNYIHDIGSYELKNGNFSTNAIGIRINKNLEDNNRDYSLYDGMTIKIKNNIIKNLYSYYTTINDAIESHGILVYGNNYLIEGNTIENLLAGTSAMDLSVYCGYEHEGIYVKGDNCTITNNVLRNACGNIGSEGAIAVKWNGLGGRIANNEIYQCFGNGIWSQCRGVEISNNQIHYEVPPPLPGKKIDRFYAIYNYVVTKEFIPIHRATKYESNIVGNVLTFEGVDNLNGFVISIDNNIDDINISNNTITVAGFIQLFRISEQGRGKEIKRKIRIQGNEIKKAYPVRNDDYVQQDILIGCSNDSESTLTLELLDNNIRYNKQDGPYLYIGNGLRNYRSDEKIHIVMQNNFFSLPQYISSDFILLENGVALVNVFKNTFELHLERLINANLTDGKCDVSIKSNQFMCNLRILKLNKSSRLNDLYFENNIDTSNSIITLISSEKDIDDQINNLSVTGNTIKALNYTDDKKRIKTRGSSRFSNNTIGEVNH